MKGQNDAKKVSEAVIKRLPRYLRVFKDLIKRGVMNISSQKIAESMGVTASQVRQDFCSFGGFGQQGYGYDVKKMTDELSQILGLDKSYNMVIFGAGNIGRALANYRAFFDEGFVVKAMFDIAPQGGEINGIPVLHTDCFAEFASRNAVDIAVITTPKDKAEKIAELVTAAGIKNIWNFAPVELKGAEGVIIENISMSDSLYVLSYKLNNRVKE
ncbi:MAG: redox-sensing transcriptional repressor Rex [Clostridiales bacterium]|jgi:redox-sensing transcriptional repressor|nr:redox-sensing transcriptional repressor Rex [Clostridiales bacterium]